MPYTSRKTGKDEITVNKKGGEVVGHTTPEKYDDYMAALHIHSGDSAADGGVVYEGESPIASWLRNYVLNHGGLGGHDVTETQTAQNVDTSSGTVKNFADGGIITPYPDIDQTIDEEGTKGSTDESCDPEYVPMPHMADGGIAPDFSADTGVDTDDSGLDKLKDVGSSVLNAVFPGAGIVKAGLDYLGQPASVAEMPASPKTPKPANVAAPNALALKAPSLPGMPPGVTPDVIASYLAQQKGQLDKYSPDREFNTEQAMLKARTGLGGSLASGAAGLADAITQGVARAGNPGFQEKLATQGNQLATEAAGAVQHAREGTMQQLEAEQKIDMQDPKSSMSQVYQKAFAPIFQKMGYDPNTVGKMPASQIQTVADLGVRYADAQTQLELKKAMLQVQTLSAQATIANEQSQRRQEALKDLQGMPWYSRVMHPGISGALEKEAGIGGAGEHPQASAALDWAQKNPNDPRAAQILKRLGK